MSVKYDNDFDDGYADGIDYHLRGIATAKDHTRWCNQDGYYDGFERAADES